MGFSVLKFITVLPEALCKKARYRAPPHHRKTISYDRRCCAKYHKNLRFFPHGESKIKAVGKIFGFLLQTEPTVYHNPPRDKI